MTDSGSPFNVVESEHITRDHITTLRFDHHDEGVWLGTASGWVWQLGVPGLHRASSAPLHAEPVIDARSWSSSFLSLSVREILAHSSGGAIQQCIRAPQVGCGGLRVQGLRRDVCNALVALTGRDPARRHPLLRMIRLPAWSCTAEGHRSSPALANPLAWGISTWPLPDPWNRWVLKGFGLYGSAWDFVRYAWICRVSMHAL